MSISLWQFASACSPFPQVAWPHWEKVLVPEPSEQLELNLVDQRPTLQWIQFFDRVWDLARSKSVDRVKEEPVRAFGVVLERCRREAADAQRMLRHDRFDRARTAQ
jgi:hypothetical protein